MPGAQADNSPENSIIIWKPVEIEQLLSCDCSYSLEQRHTLRSYSYSDSGT